jgi:lipopolysaccharide transport protein LptA
MGNTAPFGRSEKPVYVTAGSARFDHKTDVAVFTGNARGWQDNNYVRGERMMFSERDGRFVAEENVHSLLYEAKRTEDGIETNQPIYVTAQKLTYLRDGRHLRYENNVDIRQGKDRITGGAANVFLNEENSPTRTEIEQNVIMTQPNRRATGSYARYETAGELLFLRGDPATVEDAEQGRSQGSEITVNLKENRATSGRIRSVYKVKSK